MGQDNQNLLSDEVHRSDAKRLDTDVAEGASAAASARGCRICGNLTGNLVHVAREMLLGLGESFRYLECRDCGCLQLLDKPADLARYYPPDYYSFATHGLILRFLRRSRSAYAFGRSNLIGWLITALALPNHSVGAVRRLRVSKDAAILDIGCGAGRLLQDLAWLGFQKLSGCDPYVPGDAVLPGDIRLWKRSVADMTGQFDFIMLNHSYEHMDQPADAMRHVARLLKPGGLAVFHIPVASSYAWRRYGVHWVNLDAPRHFFLHTFKSMALLTERAGLRICRVVHESNGEQFWASEQYAVGIPMRHRRSLKASLPRMVLAWPKLRMCQARAEALNRQEQGDLVCFDVVKPL